MGSHEILRRCAHTPKNQFNAGILRKAVRAKSGGPYKSPILHMTLATPMSLGDMETMDAFAAPMRPITRADSVHHPGQRESRKELPHRTGNESTDINRSIENDKVGYRVVVCVDNA